MAELVDNIVTLCISVFSQWNSVQMIYDKLTQRFTEVSQSWTEIFFFSILH